jgi:hypothetical protein
VVCLPEFSLAGPIFGIWIQGIGISISEKIVRYKTYQKAGRRSAIITSLFKKRKG